MLLQFLHIAAWSDTEQDFHLVSRDALEYPALGLHPVSQRALKLAIDQVVKDARSANHRRQ